MSDFIKNLINNSHDKDCKICENSNKPYKNLAIFLDKILPDEEQEYASKLLEEIYETQMSNEMDLQWDLAHLESHRLNLKKIGEFLNEWENDIEYMECDETVSNDNICKICIVNMKNKIKEIFSILSEIHSFKGDDDENNTQNG